VHYCGALIIVVVQAHAPVRCAHQEDRSARFIEGMTGKGAVTSGLRPIRYLVNHERAYVGLSPRRSPFHTDRSDRHQKTWLNATAVM